MSSWSARILAIIEVVGMCPGYRTGGSHWTIAHLVRLSLEAYCRLLTSTLKKLEPLLLWLGFG